MIEDNSIVPGKVPSSCETSCSEKVPLLVSIYVGGILIQSYFKVADISPPDSALLNLRLSDLEAQLEGCSVCSQMTQQLLKVSSTETGSGTKSPLRHSPAG